MAFPAKLILGLRNPEQAIDGNFGDDRLPFAGWPEHLHGFHGRRFAETEVERQRALGEVTRLAIVELRQHPTARADFHRRAQAIAIGFRSNELYFEEMNWLLVHEITDKDLRAVIEVVRYNVQITIAIEIEDRRRPTA